MRLTASLVSLLLMSSAAAAQTVTLPTIRASKNPEATMLARLIQDVRSSADTIIVKLETAATVPRDVFRCDLAKLALTPYTFKELRYALLSNPMNGQRRGQAWAPVADTLIRKRGLTVSDVAAIELRKVLIDQPDACPSTASLRERDVVAIARQYTDLDVSVALRGRLDTLGRVALANVIQAKLRDRQWFPVHTHDQAAAFWKQPASSTLNIGAISGSTETGATFTEISSRFLHAVRLSFNTVIAAAKDSTPAAAGTPAATPAPAPPAKSESAIARFLNGGGLFNIAAALPAYHIAQPNGVVDFIVLLAPRVGGTLPVLGATARDTTLLYDAGVELFLKSADYVDKVGFYAQSRIARAGGSERFMTLIGDPGKKGTWYQTVSIGLSFEDKYLITISRTVAGPHSLQTGWQIGTTLMRSPTVPSGSTP